MRGILKILASMLGRVVMFVGAPALAFSYASGSLPSGFSAVDAIVLLLSIVAFGALMIAYGNEAANASFDDIEFPDFGPVPEIPGMQRAMWPETKMLKFAVLLSPFIGWACWGLYQMVGIDVGITQVGLGILLMLPVIPLHEHIHRIALPKEVRETAKVEYAIHKGLAYCAFAGRLTKVQYLWAILSPFFLLSVLPFMATFFLSLNEWFAALVIIHTAGCAGDLLMVFWLLIAVRVKGDFYQHGEELFVIAES